MSEEGRRRYEKEGSGMAMIYEPLPGGDGRPYFQCCGLMIPQPPQAMYHLWRFHGLTPEDAWAEVRSPRECVPVEDSTPKLESVLADQGRQCTLENMLLSLESLRREILEHEENLGHTMCLSWVAQIEEIGRRLYQFLRQPPRSGDVCACDAHAGVHVADAGCARVAAGTTTCKEE